MKKRFIIFLVLAALVGLVPVHQARAEDLASRLKGRILLQVESHGEAWYVNPGDSRRYYMANGSEAYNIMRNLGIGITNKDLARIKSDKTFAKIHRGKIFLQVESRGEAYYINIDGTAYYLKDGAAAYSIMRELGLGITNADLNKISLSDKDAPPFSVAVPEKLTVFELEEATVGVFSKYDFSKLISLLDPTGTANPAIYSFYLGSGSDFPPMGLILGIDGILKGAPAAAGNYKFEVCVKDVGGRSDCRTYHMIVVSQTTPNTNMTCPANSHQSSTDSNKCTCDTGYKNNSTNTGCEIGTSTTIICSANSHQSPSDPSKCICDSGYEINSTRNGCVEMPKGMPTSGRIIDQDTGKLIGGATIKVAYQDEYGVDKSIVVVSSESTIDAAGNNYFMYLPYYLPDNVAISVNMTGYIPASLNVIVDQNLAQQGQYRIVNFDLVPVSDKIVVVDNQLHHLGDDYFSGAVNSQFQLSSEGLQYSKSFTIDEQQLSKYSNALLVITTKGCQYQNQMTLNGQAVGALCCSSSDGSFGTLQWDFDVSLLKAGANQITVNAGFDDDYDDFEFIDIMIELKP